MLLVREILNEEIYYATMPLCHYATMPLLLILSNMLIVEWSLGAVIYENERRACRQCPTDSQNLRTGCAVIGQALSAAPRRTNQLSWLTGVVLCVLSLVKVWAEEGGVLYVKSQ